MGWIGAATGARFSTITPPTPPPSEQADFGPAGTGDLDDRVLAVKNATIPQAVVHPGGSPTVVNPGDNIATKITTAGVNGTLWFTKGTHSLSALVAPLSGQDWFLESIAGYSRTPLDSAVIDGNNGALNALVMGTAPNVTIAGGVFQRQGNATSAAFAAAILHNGGASGGGWLVRDAIVQDNFNIGVKFSAPNNTARRVYMVRNGRYGPNITENVAGERYSGNIIENCRWSFNNQRELDIGFAAGGSKFLASPGLIVRNCWVHDNLGFGIWSDFVGSTSGDILYENNVVEHNRRCGLFFEGVYGGCSMFRNYIYNNGYDTVPIGGVGASFQNNSQVRITNSDCTLGPGTRGDISRNVFDFDLTQSTALGAHFLLWNHSPISTDCKNWDVHLNQFWCRTTNETRLGGFDNKTDPNVQIWNGDNDFFDNEYHVASPSVNYWRWDSGAGTGTAKNYAAWKGFHPGEPTSVITI